jgi:hypothetical protein
MSRTRRARVTVVTSGHLSTCPRMLKSADALAADGHDIRVIATRTSRGRPRPTATSPRAGRGRRR